MSINVNEIDSRYDFEIYGVSYVAEPENNTAMYLTKKVEALLDDFDGAESCLVFVENTVDVPERFREKNCFVPTPTPCLSYTRFLQKFNEKQEAEQKKRSYTLTEGGYYLGENVTLGRNCFIEPGCLIGHDVIIGDNAYLSSGAVIKHAVIGDDFYAGEHCVVGARGFVLCRDENNNLMHVPTLGKVIIGNNVSLGVHTDIAVGTAKNTVIDDYVNIDAGVYIGHDSHLHRNVELASGVDVAGYCEMKEHTFAGVGANFRNRITVGENSIVGMGAAVIKSVPDNTAVVGNPSRFFSWTCRCGRALNSALVCPECGRHYAVSDNRLSEISD